MSRVLKVYGGNYNGLQRRVVAATSGARAAMLVGITMSHFRNFFCETGDDEEVAVALRKPGTVFETEIGRRAPWVEVEQ